ncbi:hypothetical protein FB45DRAFT_1033911 [Roridomyces roridus]|uniref:Uncharacterized protein n=1 Tax=Roridomyces roridus TaxID=1738132 RepID=A0AAD7BEU7_9AGAR|nr:hypothetical protein FB45DRAFT_1033911 [Roridomyces roridus]
MTGVVLNRLGGHLTHSSESGIGRFLALHLLVLRTLGQALQLLSLRTGPAAYENPLLLPCVLPHSKIGVHGQFEIGEMCFSCGGGGNLIRDGSHWIVVRDVSVLHGEGRACVAGVIERNSIGISLPTKSKLSVPSSAAAPATAGDQAPVDGRPTTGRPSVVAARSSPYPSHPLQSGAHDSDRPAAPTLTLTIPRLRLHRLPSDLHDALTTGRAEGHLKQPSVVSATASLPIRPHRPVQSRGQRPPRLGPPKLSTDHPTPDLQGLSEPLYRLLRHVPDDQTLVFSRPPLRAITSQARAPPCLRRPDTCLSSPFSRVLAPRNWVPWTAATPTPRPQGTSSSRIAFPGKEALVSVCSASFAEARKRSWRAFYRLWVVVGGGGVAHAWSDTAARWRTTLPRPRSSQHSTMACESPHCLPITDYQIRLVTGRAGGFRAAEDWEQDDDDNGTHGGEQCTLRGWDAQ